jgi:perosamine synthetase
MSNDFPGRFTTEVIDAIKRVTGERMTPLHEPHFSGNEIKYLSNCIESTWVSSTGEYINRFENQLREITGAKHVVATVNGTAALHIALICSGVIPGDEVLAPSLTFVATANAIAYCGAIPHFVDSDSESLGVNVGKLRDYLERTTSRQNNQTINTSTGRIIRAIIPMHAFGHPSDLDGLVKLAREYNFVLVEDAAEALGSYYKNSHVGTIGDVGVLSFNGNKIITTGGGGAILTNNDSLAQKARHISTTAKVGHKWRFQHDQIGYNYRMPNLNAALGCAQLEQLPRKIELKRKLFLDYTDAFSKISGARIFQERMNTKSNYWLQVLFLNDGYERYQEEILSVTNNLGVTTRPVWDLISNQTPFEMCPRMDLSGATFLQERIINLPSSPYLGE